MDTRRITPLKLLLLGLPLFVLQIVVGGWRLPGGVHTLPAWYWGAALLSGLLAMAGAWLITQARATLPFWNRAVLVGLGWGLPFSSWMLGQDALRGCTDLALSVPLLLGMSLVYGLIMASIQQRRKQS